jgi:hypothetical protein
MCSKADCAISMPSPPSAKPAASHRPVSP